MIFLKKSLATVAMPCVFHSHILKVPFEGSEGSGIVYIWIGSETTQEEAIHAEQMGRSMFEVSPLPHPYEPPYEPPQSQAVISLQSH